MAITEELYYLRMKEASLLLSQRIDKDTVRLIYERIKNEFSDSDCTEGIDLCVSGEDRLNYPNLRRRLEQVRLAREEREWRKQKKIEEIEARRFWAGQHTDQIGRDHVKRIIKVINDEMPVVEAHRELAALYPGIGHEQYIPGQEPF